MLASQAAHQPNVPTVMMFASHVDSNRRSNPGCWFSEKMKWTVSIWLKISNVSMVDFTHGMSSLQTTKTKRYDKYLLRRASTKYCMAFRKYLLSALAKPLDTCSEKSPLLTWIPTLKQLAFLQVSCVTLYFQNWSTAWDISGRQTSRRLSSSSILFKYFQLWKYPTRNNVVAFVSYTFDPDWLSTNEWNIIPPWGSKSVWHGQNAVEWWSTRRMSRSNMVSSHPTLSGMTRGMNIVRLVFFEKYNNEAILKSWFPVRRRL